MNKILTEAPIATSVAAWKKQHNGEKPDINSPEFKQFKKEVDKLYNAKQQDKMDNDKNVNEFCNKLDTILQQSPQSFPKEFYNALTNLSKKGKVNLCNTMLRTSQLPDEIKIWVQIIGSLYDSNKNESVEILLDALKESSKYPQLNKLINQRLFKEDDFNLDDFDTAVAAKGGMDTNTNTNDTGDATTSTDDQNTTDFNLDDFGTDATDDLHISPSGGSSMNFNFGDDNSNDDSGISTSSNGPKQKIIDVMFDDEDLNIPPKVKVQNMETGEIEIKNIFEVDV